MYIDHLNGFCGHDCYGSAIHNDEYIYMRILCVDEDQNKSNWQIVFPVRPNFIIEKMSILDFNPKIYEYNLLVRSPCNMFRYTSAHKLPKLHNTNKEYW